MGKSFPAIMGGYTMKTITCGDLVPGCDFKAHAETRADLLAKVSAHVRAAHPDVELTPTLVSAAKAKIREDGRPAH